MKNYVELSTVVIFAILVHSALTASLVNIFMTLHGVGGGGGAGEGVEKWTIDGDLYALRMNGGDSCSSDDVSSSSTATGQADDYSWLESYNFQQQQSSAVAKKKIIISDETTISLETYSAMLMKQRQSNNSDEEEETIESLRLKAKQSKFRYMR